ncbi:LuxR C-terminal-related transcriptional regulator [Microbacterium sp. NPDC056044]|uniref:LuxR C-terminal-related transcriptional regulator n=1 Tax=Microbacterium sp. NPDC056044 TaxID=3345690 RepID=UPI0035E2E0C8
MTGASHLVRLDNAPLHITPSSLPADALLGFVGLDAFRFPGEAARAVICGAAGAGKTTLLHRVARLLAAEGTPSAALRDGTDVRALAPDLVLLVDDAHLLAEHRVAALAERAQDPDAGLVITLRTWPARADVTALSRLIERSRPTTLINEVSLTQIRDADDGLDRCGEEILRLTGGIAWLVQECLGAHDERDCRDDPAHKTLQHAIRPRILYRLASVSPEVRRLVDDLSLGLPSTTDAAAPALGVGDVLAEGYAEGLLTEEGAPPPVIAAAVRSTTSVARLVEIIGSAPGAVLRDELPDAGLRGRRDERVAGALVARARAEAARDPDLADELLDRAVSCSVDPAGWAVDRAAAAWARGRIDDAGVLLDAWLAQPAASGPAVDLAAAVWAERGLMSLAADTYRARQPDEAGGAIRMRVAALAAGRSTTASAADPADAARSRVAPSALGVANELLDRGLTAALGNDADAAITALQRASELCTASADAAPSVELPAVVAATTAIGLGDPKRAQSIVDDALRGGQGGAHRRARLELWSSWIALQRERPVESRAALARAMSSRPLTPRDDALAATISIGIARRYDDAAGLAAEWESCLPRVSRVEPDLFSLLGLSELVIAAARLGDAVSMQPAFEAGLAIVSGLGDPPIWSTPLHWAGIQRGILLNQPDALAPHARALVAAAPHNRLATRMAHAGKVWTAVLAGTVDPDAVEGAARGLAIVGLAWDGARLAGHGAGRSEDRKVIARLLACARELHPREAPRSIGDDAPRSDMPADGPLSEREREVGQLVLQGKTYAEIGAAIFISPRTAEHHIAHIRRRLNATSRSDLLSKLRLALQSEPPILADPEPRGLSG